MMVGKQWVKSWYMYRWADEASTQMKEASSNKGYIWGREQCILTQYFISKISSKAENNVYTYKLWRKINLPTDHWGGLHGWVIPKQMYGATKWSWRDKGMDRLQMY